MRELAVKHVETDLPRRWGVLALVDQNEAGCRIDESPDQPSTGDPIDVHILSGHPHSAVNVLEIQIHCLRRFRTAQLLLNGLHCRFNLVLTWGSEEINSPDLLELAFQLLEIPRVCVQ